MDAWKVHRCIVKIPWGSILPRQLENKYVWGRLVEEGWTLEREGVPIHKPVINLVADEKYP